MKVAKEVSLCRECLFPADHLRSSCVKGNRSVVSEAPDLAGREFFPFGCFEHRIMASGAGYTSIEGAADAGGDTGSSKPPALKPKRESGANLPRNISTRMGVCRVEAVGLTSVSPRD